MKTFVTLLSLLVLFGSNTGEETGCLSAEERKLYDLLMDYRKSKGLAPIPLSPRLTIVAQLHAKDLSEHYTYDPDSKCNPHSWSRKGKWSPCCYTNDHKQAKCMWDKPREITGYPGNGYEIAYYSSAGANAEEGITGWKASPGHNPVMINEGTWSRITWNAVGIGIYKEYGVVWFGEVMDEVSAPDCPGAP